MKEIVEIYNDTDFITSSNHTNTVLSFLTLIFTLTLPAAVVAAFYGMNIPIPGALVPGSVDVFWNLYVSIVRSRADDCSDPHHGSVLQASQLVLDTSPRRFPGQPYNSVAHHYLL